MNKKQKLLKILDELRGVIRIITEIIQYFFAAVIIVGIFVQLSSLPESLSLLRSQEAAGFHDFLVYVIDMVIGIELIHLLCHPNLDNVVEVLLIAITRQLVLYESGAISTLAGVVSVAILFGIRKYLFIDKLDNDAKYDKNLLKKYEHPKAEETAEKNGPEAK